jgi:hypothetical protein
MEYTLVSESAKPILKAGIKLPSAPQLRKRSLEEKWEKLWKSKSLTGALKLEILDISI